MQTNQQSGQHGCKATHLKAPSSLYSVLASRPKSGVTSLRQAKPSRLYRYRKAMPRRPVRRHSCQLNHMMSTTGFTCHSTYFKSDALLSCKPLCILS